jgi:hypothetical protein
VWNPAPGTLDALQTAGNVTRVLAGYGALSQLAYGTVVRGSLKVDRTAPNPSVSWRVTDGGAEITGAYLSRAWATGVGAREVVRTLGADIGLAVGTVTPPESFRYSDGFVAIGSARDILDEIAADTGCAWSVQDGVLQFWDRAQPRIRTAYVFSPSTGMVGSPGPGDRKAIQVTGLLLPAMRPGDLFRVRSRDYNGDYVATSVVHRGEAAATGPVSNEFYTVAIGKPA